MLDIKELRHEGGLRYWFYRGPSDRLIVSFTGIGPDLAIPQTYEFVHVATSRGLDSALFVADTDRSWLNGPGMLDDIRRQVEAIITKESIRTVVSLGYSMGGYCALILTGLVEVECCVAYAPQFSVNPVVVPNEMRWRALREQISEHRIQSIKDYLSDRTRYFVFHGGLEREQPQRELFKPSEQLMHIIFPDVGHSVAPALRSRGRLEAVTQACFDGKRDVLRKRLAPFSATYLGGEKVAL